MPFPVNCLILGDDPNHMVTVKIGDDEDENISTLKDRIKALMKPRFNHIPAAELELWRVDYALESDKLAKWKPDGQSLRAIRKLDMFKGERDDHIHVIVKPPGLQVVDLWINCYILGDEEMFTVKISMASNNVSILKDDIKSKTSWASNIDAKDLKLWRVNLPVDDRSSIKYPNDPELGNATLLSDLFRPVLDPQLVHVVVHVPAHPGPWGIAGGGQEGRRDTVAALDRTFKKTCDDIANALAPSDSSKSNTYPKSQLAYSIHDGRYRASAPRSSVGPPIELFHPAFGHFLDGIRCTSDGNIPKDVIRCTTEYMQATSGNYVNELCRRRKLTPILSSLLGFNIQIVENDDKTKADGIMEESVQQGTQLIPFLFLLKEDKNELGDGGSDPSTQAGLSAARAWVQHRFEAFRKATACPTFLIANAGPWFAVLGFAFTERVIVQRLTDFIWVGIDSALSSSHVNRVAGIFYALKTSLDKLKSYYMNVRIIDFSKPAPTRYFPSITTYGNDPHQRVRFKYLGYLESGLDCVTLHAETDTEPVQHIVVKFVERYSERAHQILAEEGWAPRLLYHGSLHFDPEQPSYDSLLMVVMEYIDGDTFASAKSKMSDDMIKGVQSELKHALTLLHDNELVFGDLRPPNVMITKEKKVKLIDFDWAGEAGQVQYPHLLSQGVEWPKGVRTLDPVKKEHDLEMLDKLFQHRRKLF